MQVLIGSTELIYPMHYKLMFTILKDGEIRLIINLWKKMLYKTPNCRQDKQVVHRERSAAFYPDLPEPS